jgi:hypothetical protein
VTGSPRKHYSRKTSLSGMRNTKHIINTPSNRLFLKVRENPIIINAENIKAACRDALHDARKHSSHLPWSIEHVRTEIILSKNLDRVSPQLPAPSLQRPASTPKLDNQAAQLVVDIRWSSPTTATDSPEALRPPFWSSGLPWTSSNLPGPRETAPGLKAT